MEKLEIPDRGINFSGEWFKGKKDSKGNEIPPAHKNGRYAVTLKALANCDPELDNVEGVEVILETLDPNNNFYEIGRVTSDAYGMYKLMWEPPVPGEYTIIATFEGSDSYYRSYAETAMGVKEPSSPAQAIEPEPTSAAQSFAPGLTETTPTAATEATFITTDLALIAAVAVAAVIGIAAYLALRKRE